MRRATRTPAPQEAEEDREERLVEARRAAEAAEAVRQRGAGGGRLPPFAHLAVRTCFSLRDGAIRPRELAAATAAGGMTHVAITDRDGLYGAVRFAQACQVEGVTPVFGTDLALRPDLERPGWAITRAGRHRLPTGHGPQGWVDDAASRANHASSRDDPRARRPASGPAWLEDDAPRITLLARTQQGYGDLCRAVTAAHLGAERSSPHLAWEDVPRAAARQGCYLLLGVDSPVGRLLSAGFEEAARDELARWIEVFGRGAVLLGVRNWLERGDDRRTTRTLRLADDVEVTPVAINDVRYLVAEDVFVADVLACIRNQVPLGKHHLGRRTAEGWFKTTADLAPLFAERPDVLSNTQRIAETCDVDLGLGELHVPRLTGLSDEVAAGELHRRCWQGVAGRYPRLTPAIRERLERELAMVDRLGLHDYFLTAAEVVAGIRDMGVLSACRGSAAGSLVCYALRISDVDPVGNGLMFERFMNPYRDELPDIDIDVESSRREDVYRMIMARYGEQRTACVAMVETFQARMAIREVGKALGLPPDEIDVIAKSFTRTRARDVRQMLRRAPELARANLDAGQLERLFDVVERIDGFPRHLALHPCGILLADTHLQDRTALERSAPRGPDDDGFVMSQFDKDDVAALGLLKLDILAVRLLSSMAHTVELLRHTRDVDLDLSEVSDDDPETYELLRSTRSIGVFQVESPGQRELLGRLQPDRFGDLIVEISLFRPGPVKGDMVNPFVSRRHGEEQVVYPHPSLEPVLAETHGVIVYHEQVMGVIAAMTGCDLSYADLIRRQLGDHQRHAALRAWSIGRAVERGFARPVAEHIWHQLLQFASFGFCKAHAAAFAVPTYRSAWLKTHYLPEFVAGLLTHDPGMYPRRLLLDEARMFGVAVLPPDVNRSESAYTVEVVDQGLADHLLRLRADHLPPGWRAPTPSEPTDRPVPPGGWDAGDAGHGYRYAVRIGLQDLKGITDTEIGSLVQQRPFTSLIDLRRRAALSRPTAERLVDAGAVDQLAGVGRRSGPDRRRVRLAVEELWSGVGRKLPPPDAPQQEALALDADHDPQLPAPSHADLVREELAVLGLDVTRHVLSFYEPLLEHLGVIRSSDLAGAREWERVRVAGVKVAVQSPPVKSGQRVLFLTLDDRTGAPQVTFFERVLGDCAWTLLHAWLLLCEGRIRRRGPKGVTVNGDRVWDLSRLWRAWHEGWLPDALGEHGTPAPHERPASRPVGLTAAEFGRGSA
ncbi:MAG: DNA polymerase III subunit alpha [Actinobacteria bacterium]|nr:DNA polymerase III subunit alpha [Actinomycetota bacterium]